MVGHFILLLTILGTSATTQPTQSQPANPIRPFQIRVIDDQTGHGVPLVELATTNNIRYYTDSSGVVAFDEPGLMDQRVFFHVRSHGYEFPKDGFGNAGKALDVRPGGSATLPLKRINIAERLYRATGQGIYRDSVLLGLPVPIREPLLNGQVSGCDSVQTAIYRGRIYWFWGDTNRPAYPLGNFQLTGATSRLPGDGGLEPGTGVDFTYFTGEDGFVRKMAPMPAVRPCWLDGVVVLRDADKRQRMYAAYSVVNEKMEPLERGLMRFNDDKQLFEKVAQFDLKTPVLPAGHPFLHREGNAEYVYYPQPFPVVRVRADERSLMNPDSYEAYTCLKEGSRLDDPQIDRDAGGRVCYAWRHNTPPVEPKDEQRLVKAGLLEPDEVLLYLRDAQTGKPVLPQNGTVYWNPWRKHWITIRSELFGTSTLGETWYAEADSPLGPWVYARKIVTHDKYSFYNPKHHPMFDADANRVIYFEGTYCNTFSGNPEQTPRYDYNQVMYRLDLADPRLNLPVAVYTLAPEEGGLFRTATQLPADRPRTVAFFAPDRPISETVAVYEEQVPGAAIHLRIAAPATQPNRAKGQLLFYAVPADAKDPPAATVPLYEYVHPDGRHHYSTQEAWPGEGYARTDKPLCRVWPSPTSLAWQPQRGLGQAP